MKKISTIIILSSLMASGCTSQLTDKGHKVRLTSSINMTECVSLGFVAASSSIGWNPGQNTESSINKLKNETAAKGGNTLYLLSNQTAGLFGDHAVASGEALKCQ